MSIKQTVKKYRKYFLIALGVILIGGYFIFGSGKKEVESYAVSYGDVEQSVILSGTVSTSDKADLGFAESGRVARIPVTNNQRVARGQVLAQLEIGDLLADLKIKQASIRSEKTDINNAYKTLLTGGLELVPDSNNYTVEAPILSGLYDGAEGQYKVIITKENITQPDFQIYTFGLEKTKRDINEEGTTPLGTKGLYVSFPDDLDEYLETIWYLNIPNKSSSVYLENLNAYNEAKDAEDNTGDSVAMAEIEKINAEIRKNTIYAPFSGIVTNIEKEVGENASVGERVVSVLGDNTLEVVLQVSELDVSKLVPGASVQISIDAFPGETFLGTLKTVNSRETEIEGVPVYEAFVELPNDPRIKTGMSASGMIVLATKHNVLTIPNYMVKKVNNKSVVEVAGTDGKVVEKEVTLGLLGTDNTVEVISGLVEGERILRPASE